MPRDGARLYVGNVPPTAKKEDLDELFGNFGRVEDIFMREGYAFVTMAEDAAADAAIADLNGEALDGSRLRVERSHASGPGGPRAGSAAAERGLGGGRSCYNCGNEGHFARDCTAEEKIADKCWNCGQTGHRRNDCSNEPLPRAEQEKIRDAYSRARGARDGRDRDRDRERERDDYVDRRRDDHGNGGARRGGRDRDENDDYRGGPRGRGGGGGGDRDRFDDRRGDRNDYNGGGGGGRGRRDYRDRSPDRRGPRDYDDRRGGGRDYRDRSPDLRGGGRDFGDRRRRDDYGDRRGGRDDRGGRRGDDRDFDRKRQFGGRDRGDDDFEKRPRHNDRGDEGRNGAADVAPPPLSGEDLEKLAAENAKKVQNAEAVQSDW